MYCLKCGCETTANNVFCDVCLDEMKACPVNSDTSIQIPSHPMPEQEKKQKKQRPADSQVKTLKTLIRILFVTLLLLLAMLGVVSYFLLQELNTPTITPEIGKNYVTVDVTQTP